MLVPDVAGNPDQKFWSAGDVCVREAVGRDAGDDYYIWVREVNVAGGLCSRQRGQRRGAALRARADPRDPQGV